MTTERFKTLFLTERGLRHQHNAAAAAPPELDVVVLRRPDRATLWPHLADAQFLISERRGVIDAEMLAAAPHLRMVLRLGSLAYDIDTEAARSRGIVVAAWPVRSAIMVAEHVLMQMLALSKRLREVNAIAEEAGDWGVERRRTDENTFAYNWSGRHGIGGLYQKEVGILGMGEIGVELARRLVGFDCRVSYYRRGRLPAAVEAALQATYRPRDELLAGSDIVANLLPYAADTDHSLAAAEFARMPAGALLVSAGSGSVIDEAALAQAVATGHLAGAALDTYEWEPLARDNPLRRLAVERPELNILLTPHTAAGAPAGPPTAATIPSRGYDFIPIVQFLHGEPLRYRVV